MAKKYKVKFLLFGNDEGKDTENLRRNLEALQNKINDHIDRGYIFREVIKLFGKRLLIVMEKNKPKEG